MPSTAVFVFPGPGFLMNNVTSSFSSAFVVMEAAWGETRADLAKQATAYALEAARVKEMELEDEVALTGYLPRYQGVRPDNARFDCGFWGDGPIQRSHNESKSKRTMLRKRGRV